MENVDIEVAVGRTYKDTLLFDNELIFSKLSSGKSVKLSEIVVWHNVYVNGLQCIWDVDGEILTGPKWCSDKPHHNPESKSTRVKIDGFVSKVSISLGGWVDRVEIVMQSGQVHIFGGYGDCCVVCGIVFHSPIVHEVAGQPSSMHSRTMNFLALWAGGVDMYTSSLQSGSTENGHHKHINISPENSENGMSRWYVSCRMV